MIFRTALCAALFVAVSEVAPAKYPDVHCRLYTLDSVSDTLAGFGALLGSAASAPMSRYRAEYRGTVEFDALAGENRAIVTFHPDSVRFSIDRSDLADKVEVVKREMGHPILVTFTERGLVSGCRFSPTVTAGTQRYERFLLAEIQFSQPPSAPRGRPVRTWIAIEQSPTGPYKARYDAVSRSSARAATIKKRTVSFLTSGVDSALGEKRTPTGSVTIVLDREGELVSASGELLEHTAIDRQATSSASSRIFLKLINEQNPPSPTGHSQTITALENQPVIQLYEAPNAAAQEDDIERTALGDSTQEQLLAALDLAVQTDPTSDAANLYLKFRALAYMHPESCRVLAARLNKATPDGLEFQLLARALISAGTDSAQSAIAELVVTAGEKREVLSRLVPALVGLKAPTEAIISCVEKLSAVAKDSDLRNMSTMVTGAFARQLALQSSPRAMPIVEALKLKLASSREADGKRIALLALGNTGTEVAFNCARPYLKSTDVSVRSSAVAAMRWAPDRAAPKLICEALKSDASPEVRAAAADALAYVAPTVETVTALRESLRKDPEPGVREVSLASLWKAKSQFPIVVSEVRTAAKHDQSEEVRKAAKRLLGETS